MKTCPHCGERVRRSEQPDPEFGTPAVDGRRYPETCPYCKRTLTS